MQGNRPNFFLTQKVLPDSNILKRNPKRISAGLRGWYLLLLEFYRTAIIINLEVSSSRHLSAECRARRLVNLRALQLQR